MTDSQIYGAGERIKMLLYKNGTTIKQLSEMSGVSVHTLYSITKRDSQRIQAYIEKAIAPVLGCSENYILFGDEKERGKDMRNESGVSRYIKASATVTQFFPVDLKGNPDINCMQCRFFRRASQKCSLNDEICEYPQKYIGSRCPLDFGGDANEM